jgi:hypothetical protein
LTALGNSDKFAYHGDAAKTVMELVPSPPAPPSTTAPQGHHSSSMEFSVGTVVAIAIGSLV